MSSKDKARLQAIGNIMARAAKSADTPQEPKDVQGCPSRPSQDRKPGRKCNRNRLRRVMRPLPHRIKLPVRRGSAVI